MNSLRLYLHLENKIRKVITEKQKDYLYEIINAGGIETDMKHFQKHIEKFQKIGKDVKIKLLDTHSLLALQGPDSAKVLQRFVKDDLSKLKFMNSIDIKVDNILCCVTRCGYTGEDGFEISIPNENAINFANKLKSQKEVMLAGLGPRDTLRLEAGLCLMGSDMNPEITPY